MGMLTAESERLGARLAGRIRWIAVRGIAATITGVLVLGIGGRVVMLASRLLHPDAVGRLTENGNRIGEFTVEGTLVLILFGGLVSGLIAGVVWAVVKPWTPSNPAAVGLGVVSIGGFQLIDSDNPDFVILEGPAPDLVLLVGLLFAFGAVLHRVDAWLEERLPTGGAVATGIYAITVVLGVPLLIPTFGAFFSREFCFCAHPPVWIGAFLVASAAATVWWWGSHLSGADAPSRTLRILGSWSLLAAVAAGGVHLAGQVIDIL